jgi:D-tyrosyl-tRNA(Tyr) deacylase
MRSVVQKVSSANVSINGRIVGGIGHGLVIFVAVSDSDNDKVLHWMCNKIANLRVFPDEENKMNRSVIDAGGSILLISNFTLYGDVRKGFRPNFMRSAKPEISEPMYNKMIELLKSQFGLNVQSGEFGAMMDVELINDGPVTVIIDKENDTK